MKISVRHKMWFKMVGPIMTRVLKKKFNFTYEKCNIKPPFVVLCNHTLDFDPFMVAKCFNSQIYFVMSDHVASLKAGKLIKHLVSPIPITKSGVDAETTKNVFSIIKQGGAVGIFPEGNKSFAGEMSWIKPSTAKLLQKLNVPVVLLNVTGGYFSSPRWSKIKRKGHIHACVNSIITPEELQNESKEQIYERIVKGVRVNAYEEQEKNKVKFVAENRADNIEALLYACPHCNSFFTIKGEGDHIKCTNCDLDGYYNEYGYVENCEFDRLDKWDEFQKELLLKQDYSDKDNNFPITTDENWEIQLKQTKYKSKVLGKFKTIITPKYLIFENEENEIKLNIEDISGTAIEGTCSVQVQLKDRTVYRLKNELGVNGLKYVNLITKLQGGTEFKF